MALFSLLVAKTLDNGIGKNNTLPWKINEDLQLFKSITMNQVIILGRKTYESLPKKPLPNRIHIIISNSLININDNNVFIVKNFYDALEKAKDFNDKKIFVIGGSRVYSCALQHPNCETLYITQILNNIKCDVFIDSIPNNFILKTIGEVKNQDGIYYQFLEYKRQHEEYQYLNLLKSVMDIGLEKDDRTLTGVLSTFGNKMKFNLRDGCIPLLSTKFVYWKGVVEEFCWMVKGCTDSKKLNERKVKIWDLDGSQTNGDLGPIYGHQWRYYGAKYINCNTDYNGQGIDQLNNLINNIKQDPSSRRHIMTAWNPEMIDQMVLPPCHVLCQFYVANNELSCIMYQRSGDVGLGVPFNIASYSLLTFTIAKLCGLKPGDFIHLLGDTHVYKNHVEGLQKQLLRIPSKFPYLEINSDFNNINDIKSEYFILHDYQPQSKINLEMAYQPPKKQKIL